MIVSLPEHLGYRARKVRRAAIRLGRARGMTLVAPSFGRNELTVDNWAAAFRDKFGGAGLSDDDLALSLAGRPRDEPLGPGWPTVDLRRTYAHIASYASPDPDDVQAAREAIERDVAVELAQEVLSEWGEATVAVRTRWQVKQERFEFLLDAMREAAT